MEINNEFTVNVPVEKAWEVMLDLEKVAPCLPGAAIQEYMGNGEYKGTMKVKIGPVTASYKGTVAVEEADEDNHQAIMKAKGRDTHGQGTASATIVSTLNGQGDTTNVHMKTSMQLTGRASQFGGSIAHSVAEKMLGQFADCLGKELSSGQQDEVVAEDGAPKNEKSAETVASPSAKDKVSSPPSDPEPFDLGAASQEAILKRLGPVLVAVGLVTLLIWLIRRR